MEMVNLTSRPTGTLSAMLPRGLRAERVVFFPDLCPGRSPLPTGVAVLTREADWRRFAVSDCGCGMRLLRSTVAQEDLGPAEWNELADALRSKKGGLGDLGGGNHFLDALVPHGGRALHFLIHTGSRSEDGHVDALTEQPDRFDREFARVVRWAADNRAAVQTAAERIFGRMELVHDLPHNTIEPLADGGAIIRKGTVTVKPGDLNIIPSHIAGDVALVRARDRVTEILGSLSHGTGRAIPRGEAKSLADGYDFGALRERVLMPAGLTDQSLRGEGPYAYRDLDPCLEQLVEYATVVERYRVVGYMGHL